MEGQEMGPSLGGGLCDKDANKAGRKPILLKVTQSERDCAVTALIREGGSHRAHVPLAFSF